MANIDNLPISMQLAELAVHVVVEAAANDQLLTQATNNYFRNPLVNNYILEAHSHPIYKLRTQECAKYLGNAIQLYVMENF